MTLFRNVLILVFVLTMCTSLASVYSTLIDERYIDAKICFNSSCIEEFKRAFSGSIYIVEQGMKALGAATAIFGVYIALQRYLISVSSAALSGHISHLKLFQDYLISEVSRRNLLSIESIDVFVWYNQIFPSSSQGNIVASQEYKTAIENIAGVIKKTNSTLASESAKYDYKNHQTLLIAAVKKIGINLARMPKNDFFMVEHQVLNLVDAVNLTFDVDATSLRQINRQYV